MDRATASPVVSFRCAKLIPIRCAVSYAKFIAIQCAKLIAQFVSFRCTNLIAIRAPSSSPSSSSSDAPSSSPSDADAPSLLPRSSRSDAPSLLPTPPPTPTPTWELVTLLQKMPMAQRTKRKMLAIRYVAGDRSLENAGGFSDLFAAIRTSITRRIPPVNPTSIYKRLLPCLCLLYTSRVSFDTNLACGIPCLNPPSNQDFTLSAI